MADITLQIRSAKGVKRVTLPRVATLQDLLVQIQGVTGIAPEQQMIRVGYPPQPLVRSSPTDPLEVLSIRHGDTLIIEEDKSHPVSLPPVSPSPVRAGGPVMLRRVIASDNSCLFNAVGYALERHRRDAAPELRDVIVAFVMSDPVNYNEVFLGKTPEDYCRWIQLPASWGGAIEMSILAKSYNVEIACVSIQQSRVDVFGQDEDYDNRIYLLYDNIHYDVFARNVNPDSPEESDATIFPKADAEALEGALAIARELNAKRQFTDLTGCTLRCGVCMQGLKGQTEAVRHGRETGHSNFQEVTK